MASVKFFDVHRTWEDYLGMILGALVVLSPAIAGDVGQTVMLNAGIVGIVIFCLGAFELIDLRRWEESLELVFGLWLIASPFVLGYGAGTLMIAHVVLGAIVAAVALLELWQDWRASDAQMIAHGH